MRKRLTLIAATVALVGALFAGVAKADATAPTNGGSNLGGGQSGSCTGALADRPAACGK